MLPYLRTFRTKQIEHFAIVESRLRKFQFWLFVRASPSVVIVAVFHLGLRVRVAIETTTVIVYRAFHVTIRETIRNNAVFRTANNASYTRRHTSYRANIITVGNNGVSTGSTGNTANAKQRFVRSGTIDFSLIMAPFYIAVFAHVTNDASIEFVGASYICIIMTIDDFTRTYAYNATHTFLVARNGARAKGNIFNFGICHFSEQAHARNIAA